MKELFRDENGVSWYTTKDAAERYNCTRFTIRRWCELGYFPHARRVPVGQQRYFWIIPDTDFDAPLTKWRRGLPRPKPEELK